ncbi:MAG TPA: 2-C-methyl-D-erythritol 4-phosphate cytidylyltransferase [Vicinamibacterales bacterium]|nr:2-C-methyl-D-erythritol 4-phosphate cytidylyltransferase [Vicinamibacterales bacterium]
MRVTAIIAAGGRGLRFGGDQPKQLLLVAGRPILERSVAAFLSHPDVDEVVVAVPDELVDDPPPYLRVTSKPLRVVAGGERRQDSVTRAFNVVSPDSDVIVVHDGARPFPSAELIAETIAVAAKDGAALAALSSRDTVKQGSEGLVVATLARESIFLAQTPQAFRRDVLERALSIVDEATDEATLAERAGYRVRLVPGETSNIKITTPDDLPLAEAIARMQETQVPGEVSLAGHGSGTTPRMRVGTGYDLHRMVEGRPLILGGVTIPHDRGPQGHSDGDAVCHAVTDAVLGAAAAGDIGLLFPDNDARWKGASSIELLRHAMTIVRARHFVVVNVDVVVIMERPKLRPFVDRIREKLSEVLLVSSTCVSIKGKTNEGLGEIGRGEALAAQAVALLKCV